MKNQENLNSQWKMQSTDVNSKMKQMLELSDKAFKIPIISMHQEVKTSTLEMNGKTENLNKETEDIERNHMEITDLKNTMMEIKNWPDGLNTKSAETERESARASWQAVNLKTYEEMIQFKPRAKDWKKHTVSRTCGLTFMSSESQMENRKNVKQKR